MNTNDLAKLTDADLVERLQAGDRRALEFVMRRHNRMMFRAARSILKRDADAEDAVQEAYLKAFSALDGFRGDARLSTWLVRIAVNEALGRLRSRARELPLADALPEDEEATWDMPGGENPEETTMRNELGHVIEACVDRLPQDFRSVFMLREIEGMSVAETATCLSISPALVKVRLFRSRALLRQMLEKELRPGFNEAFAFDGARCDRIVANVLSRLFPVPPSQDDT